MSEKERGYLRIEVIQVGHIQEWKYLRMEILQLGDTPKYT
jgi:hypothetical protein